jgi:hypothetical protein
MKRDKDKLSDYIDSLNEEKKPKTHESFNESLEMEKLVYVHEGIDFEKSNKKRKVLKNVRYFGGVYNNSENLWLEVSEYIYKQYDVDFLETVYISGDGESWIRQGVNWLSKSKFVLDRYHLQKYVRVATTHLNDEAISKIYRTL